MAAAAIPIITTAVQFLVPLLPDLIRGVEQAFRMPSSGQDRMSVVIEAARSFLNKAMARGEVVGKPLTDPEIQAVAEAIFLQLKKDGTLVTPSTPSPAPSQQTGLFLFQGTLVPVAGLKLKEE